MRFVFPLLFPVILRSMDISQRFQGVLFAESAVSGPGGHGYYSNRDPNWFLWQDVHANTTDELLQRSLASPLVTKWHVVARCKPSGKWRYRGCYVRVAVYHPARADPFRLWTNFSLGVLLRRDPSADLLDLHASLQDPVALLRPMIPPPQLPLTRAKFSFTQLIYAYHGNFAPTDLLPYPASVNLMVFDRMEKAFTPPTFFRNLLRDEVRIASWSNFFAVPLKSFILSRSMV